MLKIRKDDIVAVTTGKDRGKRGKVLQVFPQETRVLIEGINLVKKARRRTQQNQQGGIVPIELPIHLSNVMIVCKACDKPVRFKATILKDGTKVRECKKCGATV